MKLDAAILPVMVVAALVSRSGFAADALPQGLEEIVVTGSRIVDPDFESSSPLITVPAERFERTAAVSVEATLNALPQFVGSWGSATNLPGNFGQAQLSLRGLNTTQTLVLVDGRRLVPANGNGVVDVNLIPPSLVERVEVVTGGASAVYGSDALAGVVNFHLEDHYEGIEFGGNWGQTERGDGQACSAYATGGLRFADARGALVGNVEYSRRDLITAAERDFSRVVLGYVDSTGEFVPRGASEIPEGLVTILPSKDAFDALMVRYGYSLDEVSDKYQRRFGFNSDGTVFTLGNRQPESVLNFRGTQDPLTFSDRRYGYNNATLSALQLPLERRSAFVAGHFDVSDEAQLYGQAQFASYTVDTQFAPTPVPEAYFPVTNPYVPADLKFLLDSRDDPSEDVLLAKRVLELGPRISENGYDTYQVTLGLRGHAFDDWRYDTYLQYGHSDQTRRTTGNVSLSKFEGLLFAPDGGQSTCGGLNPFGLNSISAGCASYVAIDLTDRTSVAQLTAEATLTGVPLELPAGGLQTVFGIFYKQDDYSQDPDPAEGVFLPDGRTDVAAAGAGLTPMSAKDHNADLFVETLVPILRDRPGVRLLQAVLGYRFSDYASAGGTSSYKADLLYEPVEPVRLRGSFQHAVRAPSVFELYDPQLPNLPRSPVPDPCSIDSPERNGPNGSAVEALCLAQGMTPAILADYQYDDGRVEGFNGGNPDLEPETASTYTVGVVLSPRARSGGSGNFDVSIDWYQINVDRAIDVFSAEAFIAFCYDPRANPDFDAANRYCSYFSRDAHTGEIVDAYEINRNIVGIDTSGLDVQANWSFSVGAGQLHTNALVGWLESFVYQPAPEVPGGEGRGLGCCSSMPEWKWNLSADYAIGGFSCGATWQYFGGIHSYDHRDFEVPARNYVDLSAQFEISSGVFDGLTIRAGVTNVLDEQPPIFPEYQQSNTDPTVYDVLGRRYFVGVTYRPHSGGT